MPTFLVFKSGKEVARIQGADPKKLENAVKSAVSDVSSFEGGGRKLGDAGAGAGAAGAPAAPAYVRNGQGVSTLVLVSLGLFGLWLMNWF